MFLDSEAQYMIILFLVFIVQFSVSSACLAITKEQQVMPAEAGHSNHIVLQLKAAPDGPDDTTWLQKMRGMHENGCNSRIFAAGSPVGDGLEQFWQHSTGCGEDPQLLWLQTCGPQQHLQRCALGSEVGSGGFWVQIYPLDLCVLQACFQNQSCQSCAENIQDHVGGVLHFVGGIGLFFSFTQVWRNKQVLQPHAGTLWCFCVSPSKTQRVVFRKGICQKTEVKLHLLIFGLFAGVMVGAQQCPATTRPPPHLLTQDADVWLHHSGQQLTQVSALVVCLCFRLWQFGSPISTGTRGTLGPTQMLSCETPSLHIWILPELSCLLLLHRCSNDLGRLAF